MPRIFHIYLFIIFVSFAQSQSLSSSSVQGAFGAVTIDGKIWNQVALRPIIPIGKVSFALDIVFYIDQDGNIHDDEWDFSNGKKSKNSIIDKIYYVRYGKKWDPFYFQIGALDNVTIGQGILVNRYSNTILYPQVRKVGMEVKFKAYGFNLYGFTNDFKENFGLTGLRLSKKVFNGINVGGSVAIDRNQYLGLKDSDNDGRPDLVDDFPDNSDFWLDTDGDGIADIDPNELDIDGDGISNADLIIEAIFENTQAKKDLYKALENKMKPTAILATNTSSILLEDLRIDLINPKKFIGIHFFNPVSQLPLVEIIKCDDTDQSAVDIGLEFVRKIGKSPLICKSSEGFVVNRLLGPYMAEAMHLSHDGISIVDIDQAAVDFGMPMGPVELVDTVGIDIALNVSQVLGRAYNRKVPSELVKMVEDKKLGKKTGHGFYKWESGKAIKDKLSHADQLPEDIQDRLILPMINEAVSCLNDGVVNDADLLDIGVIFGTGFAPFRGGPIQYLSLIHI